LCDVDTSKWSAQRTRHGSFVDSQSPLCGCDRAVGTPTPNPVDRSRRLLYHSTGFKSGNQSAMRLLIVTHQYLPNPNPRALRWTAIAEHWAAIGHRVDVVCGVPSDGVVTQGSGPATDRLQVHRVGIGWREQVRRRFGRGAADRSQPVERVRGVRPVLVSGLRAVYGATWRRLCWPDSASGWYRPAVRFCRDRLQNANYDALVSVSNPFTSHRVGRTLKRAYPSLRWVADIGDPFSVDDKVRVNNVLLYAQRNRRFEADVLQTADAACIVTESMTDLYRRSFPESAARMHAVPPMCTSPAFADAPHARNSQRLRLAYFGTLYRGIRSPRPLLQLFRQLLAQPGCANLELRFYGNANGCESEFEIVRDLIGRQVHLHGTVSRNAAQHALQQADVLVNLGNDLPYGLPSKVVEYAATGKPILNLSLIRDDVSARFLRNYSAAHNVLASDIQNGCMAGESTAEFLRQSPGAERATVERLLRPHRVESVAAEYERLLIPPASNTGSAA
ncbi:MAG: hypothetical protein ACE5KM_22135, partial [Planctomycetaceae bacterium]